MVVQYNDPDPIRWMALYAGAVAGCVAWEADRVRRAPMAALSAIAALWGAYTAWNAHLEVPLSVALGDWEMHSGGSEEAREAGGLLIVAVWMAALALVPRGRYPDP